MPIRLKFKQFLGIHSSSASESRILSATNTPSSRASRSAPAVVSAIARTPSPSGEPSAQTAETPNIESTPLTKGDVNTPSSSPVPPPPTPPIVSIPAEPIPDQRTMEVTTIALVADKADEVIAANASKMAADEEDERRAEILQVYYTSLQLKDTAQIISSNINVKLNEDPWFMHALDDVAKLHPFVSVAVLAFKAVYSLEMTRRQNDKRIIALYGEMKNMIEVLTRLKDIEDPETIGPNGRTIEARMQSLVAGAAQDIKDCANACDTWMKKRVLLKVLVGPAWEGKLAAFSATFNSRRMEFEFALQIHTASGIDQVQAATTAMNEKLSELTQHFVDAFSQLRPPEEAQLIHKIERENKGGIVAVRNNETKLRELYDAEGTGGEQDVDSPQHQRSNARADQKDEYGFMDFKLELQEDIDVSITNNFKVFEGKFRLLYVQLEDNLHKYMREEGDRVIEEVTKGPHTLIKDAEIMTIWRDMRWKRHVETKLFVVALRDYLMDKEETGSTENVSESQVTEGTEATTNADPVEHFEGVGSGGSSSPGPSIDGANSLEVKAGDTKLWARLYTDVKYLQPVIDAIDEDASGYVTIAEVNRFTEQLPGSSLGWSLADWYAYWARGWQTFASLYCEEILQTFARIFAMRDRILPANRRFAESYLSLVWTVSAELTKAFNPPIAELPNYAVQKFKQYAQQEEDRLRKNLVAIKYHIDALETVYAIMGQGRVERVRICSSGKPTQAMLHYALL